MERHEAWQIFIATRDTVEARCRQIVAPDTRYQTVVIALDQALDALHDATSQISMANAADDFEDIETSLFDACGWVAKARSLCRGNGVRVHTLAKIRELVEHARESLFEAITAEIPY